MPVGEPSNPISSGVRGHNSSLVTIGGPTLAALDHDFHLVGLVPSVSLCIEIPDSPNDSFYGSVRVAMFCPVLYANVQVPKLD